MLMEKWMVRFCLMAACFLIAGILFVMYQKKKNLRSQEEKDREAQALQTESEKDMNQK